MMDINSWFLQLPLCCWLQLSWDCHSLSTCLLHSNAGLNRIVKPKETHLCCHGTARSVLCQAWVHHVSLLALIWCLPSLASSEPAKPHPGMQTSMAGELSAKQQSGEMALHDLKASAPYLKCCHHNVRSQCPKRHSRPVSKIRDKY